jgi:hypothetical protein
LERGQEQPHRKTASEKQGGFEGATHFRTGFPEKNTQRVIFFFPFAGHQICGGCRLINFGLHTEYPQNGVEEALAFFF